ncbi:MAG: TrkH family potassium uptake protein [Myxococcales bacterium]|nr:TrkH family potassium uptake protein [Myxococcales bacterium]
MMINGRRVVHILGLVLLLVAGAELLSAAWCFAPGGAGAAPGLLGSAGLTAFVGAALRWIGSSHGDLRRRDGVLIVVGSWVVASVAGALPYIATGVTPHAMDALFESVSGFTTTGASILGDIDGVSHPILFWRSFTQWLGGIGIVVIFVALLSELGPGARFLFKLEVPGPKAEVLHAHVRETAVAVARIYVGLSLAQLFLMLLFGLDLFDAITHTFATVSTGGFSPHGDSIAHFSAPVQLVMTVFMLAAGLNFSLYYAFFRTRDVGSFRTAEVRVYLLLIAAASLVVLADLIRHGNDPLSGAIESIFQVVSVLTTTGFATANFDEWPGLSRALLVALMVSGGCAGSTAGGVKIVRLIIGWKAAMREIRLTVNPNAVIAVAVDKTAVPEESIRGVLTLLILWVAAWGVGAILLSVGDTGIVTAATASIATLSNIGPGLAAVGPDSNFAFFAGWQKAVMVLLMWLGRLEFFAMIALLQPTFWRR